MNLKHLIEMPPWEWPPDVGEKLLEILRNDGADEAEALLAAEMAADFTVMNDDLADALLGFSRTRTPPASCAAGQRLLSARRSSRVK